MKVVIAGRVRQGAPALRVHWSHRGVRVYDDYAHHPTKVAAVLRGARQVVGNSHAEMHEHCQVCAEACQRCEQACRDLLDSLG